MKHARCVLLLTLAVAASCPPAVAFAAPIGSPPASSGSRPGVDAEASDGGAAVLHLGEPLAIKLAGAFAIGVALGMVRVLVRHRRRRVLVAPEETAADAPPDPEPPASPSTDAALLPGPTVDDGEPVEDGEPVVELEPAMPATEPFAPAQRGPEPSDATPARERHTELFDAEYAQQAARVERLRDAVRGRIALGVPAAGVGRGAQSVPAVEVDRGGHRSPAEKR